MLPRYLLTAGLLPMALCARAQSIFITNLQATNITATTATITFSGGSATGGISGCGTLIKYAIAGGSPVNVPYAMPLQLTGLPPASAVTVQVTPQKASPFAGGKRCYPGPTAAITFTTAGALAAAPAAEANQLSLAPNPARHQTTLLLAAAGGQPTPVQVLDALGCPVRQQVLPAHATTAALDLAGLPSGLYLVRACGGTARLVVE